MRGYCTICDKEEEVRMIEIYIIGAERTNLCHGCEMMLVETVRQMCSLANSVRLNEIKKRIKKKGV